MHDSHFCHYSGCDGYLIVHVVMKPQLPFNLDFLSTDVVISQTFSSPERANPIIPTQSLCFYLLTIIQILF